MALPSAYNEISINTIYNHISAASGYGYEGGYALRALSFHGRFVLNNNIFETEDRISDFYSKDFARPLFTTIYNTKLKAPVFSASEIDPTAWCNGNVGAITANIWLATSDITNFNTGKTWTAFTSSGLSSVQSMSVIKEQSILGGGGRIWLTNTNGLATLIVSDCAPYVESCSSPFKYYYEALSCGTSEKIGFVHTDCQLTSGRAYTVNQKNYLTPVAFSGHSTVIIGEQAECTNEFAVIDDCASKRCIMPK
jgi:hypothetical protein